MGFPELNPGTLVVGERTGEAAGVTAAGRVSQVEVNGTRLEYVDKGEGAPVVLVHGGVGDYRSWRQQVDALSAGFRVIAYSRRYHYPYRWTPAGPTYTRDLHVADLVAMLEALALGPAHLVGHSYGGAVAALAARARPELVRTLALLEPSLFGLARGEWAGPAG
jgi:pimeloyl-ACP methyl ester carboxylesterase